MPGEIAWKILLQEIKLDLLLDVPIIGERRSLLKHQLSSCKDVDEIGRDALPVRIVDPAMRNIRGRKERGIDDKQRKADLEQRGRNRVLGWYHRGDGGAGGHA